MGDLNAAGTYVNEQEIANLPYAHGKIFNDMMAHWVINSSVDTTVSVNNNFTYDRYTLYNQKFKLYIYNFYNSHACFLKKKSSPKTSTV